MFERERYMIVIDKVVVTGWEAAIRGARNPMDSWARMDSIFDRHGNLVDLGDNDLELLLRLRNAGPDHRKYMRMLNVTMDIEAPLFWWKEFDTYKIATVRNSCSTMHKIHTKEITYAIFGWVENDDTASEPVKRLIVKQCEWLRNMFLETKDTKYWRELIELLPSAYMQRATVQLNYETLAKMYENRKTHKLFEWHGLCREIEKLPYSALITGIF